MLKTATEDVRATVHKVEEQRVSLHAAVNSVCDKARPRQDAFRAQVLKDVNAKSLEKEKLLESQLQDLLAHLQMLEAHHNQVSTFLSQHDYARAIHAVEELKKALQVVQRADLCMQPATEASLQFVEVNGSADGLASDGQVVDVGTAQKPAQQAVPD